MQNINKKKYEQYVKQLTPTHSLPLNMAKAFLTGGLICLLGQVILNTAQALGADASDSRTWCSVILILLSVLLTGFGIYPKIGKFGGAGSLVPITGCNLLYPKDPGGDIMSKSLRLGAASIAFSQPLYIESAASIVSQKEADGPLGDLFDLVCKDPMFGCDTWESAESTLQKETATQAISKAGLSSEDIHLMFAGDLLAQTSATCFGSAGLGIPFYGLYGACSTIGEALSLGSLALTAGFGTRVLCATSSHFASAEKEFRFPLGYGNQRPFSATWTVTGSGACILSTSPPGEKAPLRSGKGCAAITGLTAGRVMDYGLRDSMNMGGCMAPAACDTIARSFSDFGRTPSDYDAVFTGDLGIIGQKILLDLLEEQNIRLSPIHKDCGILIYDNPSQDTHAGGSGCGCSAVVLASYILPKIVSGEWKRILFVPTGALLSKVSFNEGDSIPGIAHGVVIEHMEV